MANFKIQETEHPTIIKARQAGMTVQSIADHYGVSKGTISNILTKYNANSKPNFNIFI
ncbi:helix-turn-helix domain-containing protein [Photobacterium swingsii]|uniref:helix-turn-helix domain-containing protein n=1 Tax=Photobacterium swingsii TaxID=680026 RepID=UPI003D0E3263